MRGPRSLFTGLTIGIALAASGPAAAENVLRWASVGGALTIDPHAYDEIHTWAQFAQVYEPLVGFDSNLALVPRLAVAWRWWTPTTWEFELRPNVSFHDGTPLTAADVVFSFARARTELPGGFAGRIEHRQGATRSTSTPCASRPSSRTRSYGTRCAPIAIMSEPGPGARRSRSGEQQRAARRTSRRATPTAPAPFMLKEFEPNGDAVMVRNPDWWGFERYPHNLDRIEYTPIGDPEEGLAALLGAISIC